MIDKTRWALAAVAALSTRTLIEIRAGGRGWRQELTGSIPTFPEPFAAPDESDGTRVALELDAAFVATSAAISTSPDRLQPRGTGCATCARTPRATTLTMQERR
jgi:hypothetical protein